MTTTLKVLGQSYPTAATLTGIYTVPSATTTTVSTVFVCNQSATADTFRVSVAIAGAADANYQYIYYSVTLAPYTTFAATCGLSLGATDVIRVYSTNGTSSFSVFGIENT